MASSPSQLLYRDWQRRANQFRQSGVPDDAWKMLYNRDAFNVLQQGGTPMTDADVYTGVNSAVRGPQIKDPQVQHGGHGWWSGITDVIGNVGQDVKGIITGWPAGIAHIAAHFPSELTNSGELIAHLATGDNNWLHKKGYLQAGDNLHESWSDFGTILRAMDANGSKQLLPVLPFISDLANLTTGQGRNILMQHPVGTVLDAWPGIAGAGRVITAGRDFSMAAMAERAGNADAATTLRAQQSAAALQAAREVTANKGPAAGERAGMRAMQQAGTAYDPSVMKAAGVLKEPRLWAAGRALQRGSPVRAVFAATGDLLPYSGVDELGRVTTVRQKLNTVAAASGLTSGLREGVVRAYETGKQEAQLRLKKEYFGDKLLNGLTADRAMYMWKIANRIDPETNAPLTIDAYNQLRGTLSEEENASMTAARDFTEMEQREALQAGHAGQIPLAHGETTVSKKSDLWRAYTQRNSLAEQLGQAMKQAPVNVAQVTKLANDLKAADEKFGQAQLSYVPPEWNAWFASHIKTGMRASVSQLLTGKALEEALNVIDHSPYVPDFIRVLPGGKATFEALKADAMRMYWDMAQQGQAPLWMHNISPEEMQKSLEPKMGQATKERTPTMFKQKDTEINYLDFVNGQGSVMNIAAVLNRTQAELVYSEMHNRFVQGFVLPRAYTLATRTTQYQAALDEARKTLSPEKARNLPRVADLIAKNFVAFNPKGLGLDPVRFEKLKDEGLLLDKDTYDALKKMLAPPPKWMRNTVIRKGTSLYKFSVLTGPRHLAHVGVGGFMMMMGGEPLAPAYFWRALKLLSGRADPEDYGLAGASLSGMKEDYYRMGPRHTYQDYRIPAERGWAHQTGGIMGEHYLTQLIHKAAQVGKPVAEFVPNELSKLETNLMTMYKTSVYLSRRGRGMEEKAALEGAHKLFVDMNGMSTMERTVMRTIFPFYAFTRHLFRYLGTYPVDYPLRASIITNFAEQEQADWQNGLPRSYQSLFMLGSTNSLGDVTAFDLKNANPFRSFANDFSLAGFTSSLSPFITMPMNIAGIDTLSGTTQLYPGTTFNPFTGTIQSTPQPGWQYSVADAFVPQFGLFDHYLKLTESTKFIAATDPAAYRKQLYNMLNMPFMPEVINVPYAKEITEMRRFRQAQAMVSTVKKNPSAQNVSKLLEFNVVPFDNTLIPSQVIAAYFEQVKVALERAGQSQVSPAAVYRAPPKKPATLSKELAPTAGP